MNFRGGFPIPRPEFQFEGCLMPVTPEKPPTLARSNSVLENPQGNHQGTENLAQQTPNYSFSAPVFNTSSQAPSIPGWLALAGNLAERNPVIMNHIPGSYQQQPLPSDGAARNNLPLTQLLLQRGANFTASPNSALSRYMRMAAKRPLMPSQQPQTSNLRGDCSLGGFSSGSSFRPEYANVHCQVVNSRTVGSNSVNLLCREQNHCLTSEQLDNDDFRTPSKINYDLNASPTINSRPPTNAANLVQFTPVTPDQAQRTEKQRSAMLTSTRDESTSQETDKAGNLLQNVGDEAIQQQCDELLQNIVDLSSTLISTPLEEKKDSDKRSDLGIDLNETPPQKPPKRRKHRPKVVVEGKPKRTRKPAVPKNTESKENRPAKRKYVRKNVPKDLKAQEVDTTRETTEPNTKKAQKTCKRVLIFNLEGKGDENQSHMVAPQKIQDRNRSTLNITVEHQTVELDGTNRVMGAMSSVQNEIPKRFVVENQMAGKTDNGIFNSQIPNGYVALLNRQAAVHPLSTAKDVQTRNSFAIGRHKLNGNADRQQTRKEDEHVIREQHKHAARIGVNGMDIEKVKQLMQNLLQSVPKTPSKSNEPRGSKRDHSQTIDYAHLSTTNHLASLLNTKASKVDECLRNGHTLHAGFPQNNKKKKIGGDRTDVQNMPFNVKVAEGDLENAETRTAYDVNGISIKPKLNFGVILNSHLESRKLAERENSGVILFTGDKYVHSNASKHNSAMQKFPPNPHSHAGRMGFTTVPNPSNPHSHAGRMGSTAVPNPSNPHSPAGRMESTTVSKPLLCSHPVYSTEPKNGQILQTCCSMPEMNKNMVAPPLNPASSGLAKLQEHTPKRIGTKKKPIHSTPIDEIIYRLQILDLNGGSNGLQKQDQNALVLYNGDGALVPYEGFNFIKKRKPRPKVDLDPETNRIWNLLMGKEGSEDLEENDKEKEKFWEEERKVFQGRVDSFIARMHLVQGDRRFSRWKGSVVDSVIGVFLTQNVSDHLSSSAFMSMAARFPLRSSYNTQEVKTNIVDVEAPISVINPDDTIRWYEVSSEPSNNQNTTHETVEHQYGSDNAGSKRSLIEAQSQSLEEEFILSQDSFDSSITQVAGGIRSCSGSNSETEDPSTRHKLRNSQVSAIADYLRMEKSSWVQEVCSEENACTVLNEKSKYEVTESSQLKSGSGTKKHVGYPSSTVPNNLDYLCIKQDGASGNNELTDSRRSELWRHETFSEESISSWQPPASRSVKGPEAVSQGSRTREEAGNFGNFCKEQNGQWNSQENPITDACAVLSTDFMNQQGIPVPGPNVGQSQFSSICHQHRGYNMYQLDSTSIEPVKHAEALAQMHNRMDNVSNVNKLTEKTVEAGDCSSAVNMQTPRENKLAEQNLKEQICSSNQSSNLGNTKNSKARKGNSESEKKKAVDWDNLRKQVETNGRKKERRKDAMDSLDYEAVRKADVSEISNAIKERGMNNMLAERIKEFLNRIVRDHGSIDLEWLRDVPPDKAKDYLLSVRGLGLKSVECVRLLTLHHLAFPVDTNVGRIVVRLGWVPLQPLPESLQLHLLELYPILESIQKYLWPRLCKLDQRTLYELHYQMITFGKVFCTKSKPNCNACPMRGECRHFASAFTSARLALPAPEDRSIVSSTVPQTANNYPGVVIHPMTLPAPQNDSITEVGSKNGNCEPIIEEPATPEQECAEISQSDIEDSFYEDPCEIPTIKLNMEEFTENLQNYMQKNMELQEADMSKALVALTPDIASIPLPKLKNVSRLRTEHQVYELPDSHPLLERLERREPDDPSPYLLAIWTPGETANSIQPPEKSCGSEPDKLCDDTTCFSCNSVREANSQTVRGTILIPCRTAMRGSFPLNGTYFQVNEVFADHESSLNPINVPRGWIWNLPRRMVYFGTSVSTIFKGLSTEGIQYCFWKGFVCVRGFDLTTRAPRPLMARLHFPASKLTKAKNDEKR